MKIMREKISTKSNGVIRPLHLSKGRQDRRFSVWRLVSIGLLILLLLAACDEQSDKPVTNKVSPPLKVDAMGVDSKVLLQWDAVDGAEGYNIYWSSNADNSSGNSSLTVQASNVTIDSLQNDNNYFFRVTSLSSAGESVAAASVSARTRAAKLVSIVVTPEQNVINGTSLYFTATGVYADGSQQDISRWAKWQSSDTSIATVRKEGRAAGLVSANQVGSFVISAAFQDVSGWVANFSQSVPLREIIILPHNPQIASETQLSFKAVGLFSYDMASYGNIIQDLTATVNWASENPSIASISSFPGFEGMTRAFDLGDSVISASFAGQVAQSSLRVAAVELESITITPFNPSISSGMTQAFSAIGNYSDGSTQDISESLLWESSDITIATVSNYSNGVIPAGQANATYWGALGSTVITARLQNVTASTTLTVSAPKVVALSLEPATLKLMPGAQSAIKIFQVYDNGSRYAAEPGLFNWSSADTTVATVDANGLVTAVIPGFTTSVSVSDPASPELSASAFVTVVDAPADHNNFIANCYDCHDGAKASTKPVTHMPSDNLCETCHSAAAWIPAIVDHSNIFTDCVSCHNGIFAAGKSAAHINSSDLCEACHLVYPATWVPVPAAAVDHSQVFGSCESCHDGLVARGKGPTHCPTTAACDTCHNTFTYIGAPDCPLL